MAALTSFFFPPHASALQLKPSSVAATPKNMSLTMSLCAFVFAKTLC